MESIHSYLSAGIAVVVGALIAGAYTSYLYHLASKNEIIKDYLSDLDVIERLSREYWLFEAGSEDDQKHECAGHELRARIDATGSYIDLTQEILGTSSDKFTELDVRLSMAATGGSFQTKSHSRSPERYSEITSILSEMRALLRSKRNKMFWSR
ncbi:hypothetical protein T7987_07620 [Sulfitobacter faviae]|uniref:Uncharacterized protein n=1 Tax=Sulfitobacter faviae TaxID=1775881 RepID=A0ABZ0V7M7_9RHOB|nr:hypothetical protein [Sulfitobacter faviae]WPZ23087.1 hypothetical protein T7987_07620 [Sulfitobacter faviae]